MKPHFFHHTINEFAFSQIVALFGHIAPQRPVPEMLHSLSKPFGGKREEEEGILSCSKFKKCLLHFSIDIENNPTCIILLFVQADHGQTYNVL